MKFKDVMDEILSKGIDIRVSGSTGTIRYFIDGLFYRSSTVELVYKNESLYLIDQYRQKKIESFDDIVFLNFEIWECCSREIFPEPHEVFIPHMERLGLIKKIVITTYEPVK